MKQLAAREIPYRHLTGLFTKADAVGILLGPLAPGGGQIFPIRAEDHFKDTLLHAEETSSFNGPWHFPKLDLTRKLASTA